MRLAARGTRNMDDGEQKIAEPRLKARLRRQALKVYAESALAGGVLTALVVSLPA